MNRLLLILNCELNLSATKIIFIHILLSGIVSPTLAEEIPYALPQKQSHDTGPEFISPEKGNIDPLNKNQKLSQSKTIRDQNNQVSEFVGVVQYTNGSMNWSETDRRDPIAYKTLFHWNESALIARDSTLKIVTRHRCVGVIYGKSQLQTPLPSANSSWNILGGSLRWICGPERSDHLYIDGHAVNLTEAEILYHDQQLFVIHGRVVSESGELSPGVTYVWQDNQWKVKYSLPEGYQSWQLTQELPAPKESLQLPRPVRIIHSRWSIGPTVGSIRFQHPNSRFNIEDSEINGARLQANFKWKEKSVIAGISYYESENKDQGPSHFDGPPDRDFLSNHLESTMLEIGWRSRHQESWAWIYRLGLGQDQLRIDSFGPNFSYHRRIFSTSARLSAGVDKIFFAESLAWGGLMVSAEIYFHQSLKYQRAQLSETEMSYNPNPEVLDHQKDSYNAWGVILHLAPLLQF